MTTKEYLDSVRKQFAYYQLLGEKTFAQLDDDQLFWRSWPIIPIPSGKSFSLGKWHSMTGGHPYPSPGNSQVYNAGKFAQPKRKEHFTDELGNKPVE